MFRWQARRPLKDDQDGMFRLANGISKLLVRAALALFILLLLSQLALQNDTIRGLATSADRWEGTRLN